MSSIASAVLIVCLLLILISIFDKSKIRKPFHVPKQYGVTSFTEDGLTVRSNAEKRIADYFTENNILFEYEKAARGVYGVPDFYLPQYDVYVEYWGLLEVDDPSVRYRYEQSMRKKMAQYYKNKIKFISIYPRNLDNLDWVFRKKLENVTGRKLHH
jgi:hypothetical protein